MRCCQRVVEQGAEATTDIATAGTEAEATVARLGLVVVPAVRRWVVGRRSQLFCLQPYLLLLLFCCYYYLVFVVVIALGDEVADNSRLCAN